MSKGKWTFTRQFLRNKQTKIKYIKNLLKPKKENPHDIGLMIEKKKEREKERKKNKVIKKKLANIGKNNRLIY